MAPTTPFKVADGTRLLGEIIAWTCAGVAVRHATLIEALSAAGLDPVVISVQNGPTREMSFPSKTVPSSATSCRLVHQLFGWVARPQGGGGWSRWRNMPAFDGLIDVSDGAELPAGLPREVVRVRDRTRSLVEVTP